MYWPAKDAVVGLVSFTFSSVIPSSSISNDILEERQETQGGLPSKLASLEYCSNPEISDRHPRPLALSQTRLPQFLAHVM